MRRTVFRRALVVLLGGGLLAAALGFAHLKSPLPRFSVLVFSKTEGYRHASISAGTQAIQELGDAHRFTVKGTEDADVFTAGQLDSYDVGVFLSTTGGVLNALQQEAFTHFMAGS